MIYTEINFTQSTHTIDGFDSHDLLKAKDAMAFLFQVPDVIKHTDKKIRKAATEKLYRDNHKAESAEYRKSHRTEKIAYVKEHSVKIAAQKKENYRVRKHEIKRVQKIYYQERVKDPAYRAERIRSSRIWQQENIDHSIAYQRNYYLLNKERKKEKAKLLKSWLGS